MTLEKQKVGRSSPEKKDWGQGQGLQKRTAAKVTGGGNVGMASDLC